MISFQAKYICSTTKFTAMKDLYSSKIVIIPLICFMVFSSSCNKCDDFFWEECDEGELKKGTFNIKLFEVTTKPSARRVNILIQVYDDESLGISDLSREDFDILENGEFIDTESNLTIATNSIPADMRTILLLDISSSVTDFIQQIKDAAKALVENKLSNQKFAIYTFDKELSLVQDFSSSINTLTSKINSIPSSNLENSTNLYGAIVELTNSSNISWVEEYSTDQISVQNLIVFTDGRHNANPSITLNHALNSIGNKKVYVAALQSPDLREEPLQDIANQGYFLASNINELKGKFGEVQDNIRNLSQSLYYLYYTSPISDPSSRSNSLEIRIKGNENTSSNGIVRTSFNSSGFN